MSSGQSSNVVGVHYRVGKKIGEGSFGVIFEGHNLLNNTQVAIKFVRASSSPIGGRCLPSSLTDDRSRSLERRKLLSFVMSTEHISFL